MLDGNDRVNAFGGNDIIDGGAGNDTLRGGSGNDTLIGETDIQNYIIKSNYNHFTQNTFTNTTKQDNIKTYLYIHNSLKFNNNKREVA